MIANRDNADHKDPETWPMTCVTRRMSTASATLPTVNVRPDTGGAIAAKPSGGHGQGAFSRVFHEILDIINPLQHIPIVSTIYRHLTGDTIDPVAKVAGGALFGGMIGLGLSVADVAVEEATGKDVGDHIWALFDGDSDKGGKATAIAAAPTAARTRIAQADDRVWFPAFPAGAMHPAALSYPAGAIQKPATANSTTPATAMAATAQDAATPPTAPQAQTAQAKSAAGGTGAIPQMNQATFDALIRSFGNKAVAGITPAAPDDRKQGPRDAAGQPTDTLGAGFAQRAPGAGFTQRAPGAGLTQRAPSAGFTQRAPGAQAAQPAPAASAAPGAWSNPNLNAAKSGYAGALKAMEAALDRYQAQGGRIPPAMPILRGQPGI
jgi:hypothetical protein